jgi:hypothetical protein
MDVLVDGVDCLLFGLKYGVMCQFGFERVEKAFRNGIVCSQSSAIQLRYIVTVSLGAHALDHAVVVEFIFEPIRGILTSSVGVEDGSAQGGTLASCVTQSLDDEIGMHRIIHCPSHNLSAPCLNFAV